MELGQKVYLYGKREVELYDYDDTQVQIRYPSGALSAWLPSYDITFSPAPNVPVAERVHKTTPVRQRVQPVASGYGQIGQLNDLLACPLCVLCAYWGELVTKTRGKAFCGSHLGKPPKYFRCETCKEHWTQQRSCCGEYTKPVFNFKPKHLRNRVNVPKNSYAQVARSGVAGLNALDRVCELIGVDETALLALAHKMTGVAL